MLHEIVLLVNFLVDNCMLCVPVRSILVVHGMFRLRDIWFVQRHHAGPDGVAGPHDVRANTRPKLRLRGASVFPDRRSSTGYGNTSLG